MSASRRLGSTALRDDAAARLGSQRRHHVMDGAAGIQLVRGEVSVASVDRGDNYGIEPVLLVVALIRQ